MSQEPEIEYWKNRCFGLEQRMDELEKEILRLLGFKPLTKEQILSGNLANYAAYKINTEKNGNKALSFEDWMNP